MCSIINSKWPLSTINSRWALSIISKCKAEAIALHPRDNHKVRKRKANTDGKLRRQKEKWNERDRR